MSFIYVISMFRFDHRIFLRGFTLPTRDFNFLLFFQNKNSQLFDFTESPLRYRFIVVQLFLNAFQVLKSFFGVKIYLQIEKSRRTVDFRYSDRFSAADINRRTTFYYIVKGVKRAYTPAINNRKKAHVTAKSFHE